MHKPANLDRRTFLKHSGILCAAAALPTNGLFAAAKNESGLTQSGKQVFCAFDKPLNALSHGQMADFFKNIGYSGIEATVRPGGRVTPERVEEDLPKLVEALKNRGMEITIMTSGVDRVSPLNEKVLRTASRLGVKRYRMLWWRYDLNKPIWEQLQQYRPILSDLVAMNKELGITGLYQNHAGANMVGASLWDVYSLMREHDPKHIALAYDIRHAQVEAGVCWPSQLELVKSHIGAVCVKDYEWKGASVASVPLGSGRVTGKVIEILKRHNYTEPYSVHIEHLGAKDSVESYSKAYQDDLSTLKRWLA
jgi:sugar phosphate isomerase/epimerase